MTTLELTDDEINILEHYRQMSADTQRGTSLFVAAAVALERPPPSAVVLPFRPWKVPKE